MGAIDHELGDCVIGIHRDLRRGVAVHAEDGTISHDVFRVDDHDAGIAAAGKCGEGDVASAERAWSIAQESDAAIDIRAARGVEFIERVGGVQVCEAAAMAISIETQTVIACDGIVEMGGCS